ncbi:MAG: hypothetical protein ABSB63_05125 [Spirochaetia bacterium]|jgi:hypothetical protein
MKKSMALLLFFACLPAWSLDWKLPVFTLRYEAAGGESEDPDDETLQPSSLRNTVSLRVKEDVESASFGLTLRSSMKDYYLQAGDYSYLDLEHDGTFHLGEAWKLGYLMGMKGKSFPELDWQGLPKDTLALKAGMNAAFTVVKGTTLEAGTAGRWELADNAQDSLQAYVLTAGFSTRLGEWLLGARYRGEYRLPLGSSSGVGSSTYNMGSVSLQWDPNR